jgi:EAL domain-containing protein (putative c-di-GMP-specific phosphodiesterase class I)
VRESDTLARLGGDEFAILMPSGGRIESERLAEALLRTVRAECSPRGPGGPARPMTASIGVAPLGVTVALTPEEALINADLAMYDAKEAGRDRVAVYSPEQRVQPQMKARMAWIERIRRALDEGQLTLHAQPIVELDTGETHQYELLLRMLDDTGDTIPPASFISIAERYDLIQELDRWVAAEAVKLIEQYRDELPNLAVEINVSGKSLGDPQLSELVESELRRSGIDPASLIFEVTETAAVSNIEQARQFAERLSSLGCRFALDDFGRAFGTFYYLKHIPFDYLKIDSEFVTRCTTNRIDQEVIKGLVSIATGLHRQTIAEGVESRATQRFLRRNGVDYAQGFHIGRPLPIEEALRRPSTPIPR